MRLWLVLFAVVIYSKVHGQSSGPSDPGRISQPATLPNVMDPNGDGWVTTTGNIFNGPLDEAEFEIPYVPLPQYETEPVPDNQVPSTSCTIYELVGDALNGAESTYYYYRDPDGTPDTGDEQIFFRFRVARLNGSGGLSILVDTDGKFGFTGPEQDPNAVAGNPGFELEISATTSSGSQIRVYDADGTASPTVVKSSYSTTTNLQISYALNQASDCSNRTPGFIDFYIPFSALGISSTTSVRIVGASSEFSGSMLGGNADDIAGVDGNAIPSDDDQFIAVIGGHPPFTFPTGVNRGPSASDGIISMDENKINGSVVYTVSASDPDGDAMTYTITGGNTATAFAINSAGQITVNNTSALDFESTPSFNLTVRVSDGALFDDATITINLNNINEPPTAQDATVSLNENSANGTVVHTVVTSDPEGDMLSYSMIIGTPFAINNAGEISVYDMAGLNYETTNSFILTVNVFDEDGNSEDAVITINLSNVNETPSVSDATVSLDENSANGTAVHTVQASDPDGDVLTYSIVAGNTGTAFAVDGSGQITVNNASALDFETTPSITLTVRASDGILFDDAAITINLNDINETPVAADATVMLDEKSANGTPVHPMSATDPDGDPLAYSITGGNTATAFAIDASGQITVNNSSGLDFETTPIFTLTVRASDGTLFDDAVITINLNDVNETPLAVDATVTLDENTANGSPVHAISASDPDGDPLAYTITGGNTGTAFAIDASGQITVNNSSELDFETTPTLTLTVRVSDGTLFDDAVVTVNLNDLNETPLAANGTKILDENSTNGVPVYTMSAADPDGDPLTYTITGGNTATAFAIDASGQITVNNSSALDFETTPTFTLAVRVSDGTLFDDAIITVNLKDINEIPVAVNATVQLDENSANGTPVHAVSATDPDDDALTYTITAGNITSAFAINSSGQITVNNSSALDFESTATFTLTVRASDGSLFDEALITINLNDLDETPPDINNAPIANDAIVSINENSVNGTAVHPVSATDPDGDALTYVIIGGDPEQAFTISSTTGQITVNDAAALDFENISSFTLTVRVSDETLFDDAVITVNLTNVNEPPLASDATVFIDENSATGSVVHALAPFDPEGSALTYTIIDGNTSDAFEVSNSGVISVNNASSLDYETTPSFTIIISVSDGTLSDDAVVTINLNDLDDLNAAPTVSDAIVSLDENSPDGTVVHTLSASDPDGDALTYTITSGNDDNRLTISATGVISVTNSAAFDFERLPTTSMTVRVSDGQLFSEASITINIVDMNEPPSISDAVIKIPEEIINGSIVYQVVADDPDTNDVAVFSIESGNTGTAFLINAYSGEVIVNNIELLDEGESPVYDLLVMVTDAGGLTATATLTIEIEVVDEEIGITPLKAFSPNGDGINDFWLIKGIEAFPDNEVKVFNRWGVLVYEARHYNNQDTAWRGEHSGRLGGGDVPETTYYFLIRANGLDPISGYVIMK